MQRTCSLLGRTDGAGLVVLREGLAVQCKRTCGSLDSTGGAVDMTGGVLDRTGGALDRTGLAVHWTGLAMHKNKTVNIFQRTGCAGLAVQCRGPAVY